jgi:Protein of unknown function (DUF2892)
MTTWQITRVVAGLFILASIWLGLTVNPWWFGFTAFVGINLLQSGFTKWCLMERILRKLGAPAEA